jgi:hypothetical protein
LDCNVLCLEFLPDKSIMLKGMTKDGGELASTNFPICPSSSMF